MEGLHGETYCSKIQFLFTFKSCSQISILLPPSAPAVPPTTLINAPTLRSPKSGNFSSSVGNGHWTYLWHCSWSRTYFVRDKISLPFKCKGIQSIDRNIFAPTPSLQHVRNTNGDWTCQEQQGGGLGRYIFLCETHNHTFSNKAWSKIGPVDKNTRVRGRNWVFTQWYFWSAFQPCQVEYDSGPIFELIG